MSQSFHILAGLSPGLKKLIIVMCGGSLGAASRYAVGLLTARIWGTSFPWGTLVVNLTGCFLIGFIFSLSDRIWVISPELRLFLITGYLGALTTFSSYSLETVNASLSGLGWQAIANVLLNTLAGMTLTLFGLWLGGHR